MVKVAAAENSKMITITGHGLTVESRFEFAPGIFIAPAIAPPNINDLANNVSKFHEYAAILSMLELSTFSIEIHEERGGEALATKGWNALWLFHLLSLACKAPCFSLFSISKGDRDIYSVANRNIFINALPSLMPATVEQLQWAQDNFDSFDALIADESFSSAMLCFGNAHYLFDRKLRIMLIWSGIEGLFSIDGELRRRLALYAALLSTGTAEEKIAYFKHVKDAYGLRSKVVHGGIAKSTAMDGGCGAAADILSASLARCVELGRVPTPAEFDALSVSQRLL